MEAASIACYLFASLSLCCLGICLCLVGILVDAMEKRRDFRADVSIGRNMPVKYRFVRHRKCRLIYLKSSCQICSAQLNNTKMLSVTLSSLQTPLQPIDRRLDVIQQLSFLSCFSFCKHEKSKRQSDSRIEKKKSDTTVTYLSCKTLKGVYVQFYTHVLNQTYPPKCRERKGLYNHTKSYTHH